MSRPADGPATPVERRRSWLVATIALFYVLLLAEGALRKWIVPVASNALVFVRDPVMLVILGLFFSLPWSRFARRAMAVVGSLALLLLVCAALQALTTDVPGLALLVGFRNYLLFLPLCVAIPEAFHERDYRRWMKLNLLLAPPIAALVLAQYRSSPSAPINGVPGGGNDGVFLLVADVVRPYGLFSFALGHSAYAAWMLGLAFVAVTARQALGFGLPLVAAGCAGIVGMGLLSGARTYFLFAAAVVATALLLPVLFGPVRVRLQAMLAGLGLGLAGAGAFVALPSLAADLMERQSAAVASEGSTLDRILRVGTEFWGELGRVPAFGYGLGSGTNVANFLANGRTDHVLAEYELTRIVQEIGPAFGLLYIALRWAFIAGCGLVAIVALRKHRNPQPACWLGFLIPVFLAHDITLQNSMIGIAWFAAGIFLCAVRLGAARFNPDVPPCA